MASELASDADSYDPIFLLCSLWLSVLFVLRPLHVLRPRIESLPAEFLMPNLNHATAFGFELVCIDQILLAVQ